MLSKQSIYVFYDCSKSIQFLILNNFFGYFSISPALHPCLLLPILSLPNTVSKAIIGTLPHTVQHLCYLRNAMLCQWSPDAFQPLFREAEDILIGGKYPKHMPLLTFLVYLKLI